MLIIEIVMLIIIVVLTTVKVTVKWIKVISSIDTFDKSVTMIIAKIKEILLYWLSKLWSKWYKIIIKLYIQ